jgi:quercetin dioxygenase-like cupin family protein
VRDGGSTRPENPVNLKDAAATAGERAGVIWTLDASSDLNANLMRLGTGQGVVEHVNDGVEVIVVGVAGSGIVRVDREEYALSAGTLMFIPKRARRSTVSTSEDLESLAKPAGEWMLRSSA